MARRFTEDQMASLRRAWVVRRNVVPITALDDNGYGYRVNSDDALARERFAEILLSYQIEREEHLHTRRRSIQANKKGGDAS